MSVKCPRCGSKTLAVDSRPMGSINAQWRKRKCTNPKCGCIFETTERIIEGSDRIPYAVMCRKEKRDVIS